MAGGVAGGALAGAVFAAGAPGTVGMMARRAFAVPSPMPGNGDPDAQSQRTCLSESQYSTALSTSSRLTAAAASRIRALTSSG
jgi:hypothetical protein